MAAQHRLTVYVDERGEHTAHKQGCNHPPPTRADKYEVKAASKNQVIRGFAAPVHWAPCARFLPRDDTLTAQGERDLLDDVRGEEVAQMGDGTRYFIVLRGGGGVGEWWLTRTFGDGDQTPTVIAKGKRDTVIAAFNAALIAHNQGGK